MMIIGGNFSNENRSHPNFRNNFSEFCNPIDSSNERTGNVYINCRENIVRSAILSTAAIVLALGSAPAFASGSGGGGGGYGGFSGGSGASAPRISPAERLERRGKSQVRKRITCKKCSYHGKLNQQTAAEVAKAVQGGQFNLKGKNREAVLYYLRQRYGV